MTKKRHPKSQSHQSSNRPKDAANPSRNIAVVIPQPLSVRQESTSQENDQYREERHHRALSLAAAQRLNRITIFGIVATSASIVITIVGSVLVYLSYQLTREQFIRSERPYVMVTRVDLDNPSETDALQETIVGITEADFGKEPALEISMHARVFLGSSAYNDAAYFYDSLGTNRFDPRSSGSVSSLAPNGAGNTIQALRIGRPMSKEEVSIDTSTDGWLVAIGKIQYQDTFGTPYETSFCKIHLRAGGWADCSKYNEMK